MKYLITLCLLLTACEICPDADYEIKNRGATLACHGYDDKYVYDGEYCKIVSCIWDCAHYNGDACEYVDLTFMSCSGDNNGSWYLDHTYTQECI